MSEYIKREDALKKLIDAIHNDGFAAESGIERRELREDEIEDAINAIPAADVEPVVRCRNCCFWEAFGKRTIRGVCKFMYVSTNKKHYCAYGLRRKER